MDSEVTGIRNSTIFWKAQPWKNSAISVTEESINLAGIIDLYPTIKREENKTIIQNVFTYY